MYAIRSYYDIVLLSLCVTMVLAYMGTGYSVNERRVEFVIGSKSVITSYSIHYTKLYEI